MRQLITRVPDDLHEQLKRHARARGQSVNELVVGLLVDAVAQPPTRDSVRQLLLAQGLLFVPPSVSSPPSHAEIAARHRGRGPALSEALDAERSVDR